MLLTDGAVWDVQQIVNLVKQKSSLTHRFHTFGVGQGASEDLIKRVALDGYGQYYFIYDDKEIEETVVKAIQKTQTTYKYAKNIQILDQNEQPIQSRLQESSQPVIDGNFIQFTEVLESGVRASYV